MRIKNLDVNIGTQDNASFQEFLIAEYNNIAEAHFNTVNSISNFFRYYLLIVTIPIPISAFLIQNTGVDLSSITEAPFYFSASLVSLVIFFVGICVVTYIMNLRFDAILYARSVNGIRRYFYQLSQKDIFELKKTKVLPTSVSAPLYTEWRFFYFVILALSIINGMYLLIGIFIIVPEIRGHHLLLLGLYAEVISLSISTVIYIWLSNYREKIYLARPTMGVDIDGVLNKHRQQFCITLKDNYGKDISPESITKIPVQDCKTLECSVFEEECLTVFNDPSYWKEMPAFDGCARVLTKLSNIFNYKIEIFTYRPWPEINYFPKDRINEFKLKWHKVHMGWRIKNKAIKKLTKKWLKDNKIPFNKLTIESGSEYTPNPKMRYKNRFQNARKKNYAYFVEDEVPKAKKLAQFCDIVFLIDQPYNRENGLSAEKNIIRVNNWEEIYEIVKEKL
jgi:uncharacterized HAD superfamily protein